MSLAPLKVLCHLEEILQGLIYAFGKSYPLAFYVVEGFLHMTEKSSGSREGDFHISQLA